MEGEAVKTHLLTQELEGPGCAVARIAHHGMSRKPGVTPDLMLAAGQKVALNEGVMGASPKDPEAGLGRDRPGAAFGMEAAPRLLRQGPSPEAPAIFRGRVGEISVEEGDIALPDLVVFELLGEVGEGRWPAGQEDNAARLPVKAVDGKNPKPGITVDLLPEVRVGIDPRLKDGTEVLPLLFLDAQPGGLLNDEPTPARRED